MKNNIINLMLLIVLAGSFNVINSRVSGGHGGGHAGGGHMGGGHAMGHGGRSYGGHGNVGHVGGHGYGYGRGYGYDRGYGYGRGYYGRGYPYGALATGLVVGSALAPAYGVYSNGGYYDPNYNPNLVY